MICFSCLFPYTLFSKTYCQNSFKGLKKFPMHDSVVLAYQITSAFIEKKAKTLKYKVI